MQAGSDMLEHIGNRLLKPRVAGGFSYLSRERRDFPTGGARTPRSAEKQAGPKRRALKEPVRLIAASSEAGKHEMTVRIERRGWSTCFCTSLG